MENKTYDFGIIGSGPAGFTTAIHAAQNGNSVVIFEKENLGGVCLNKGCIPTKTIIHSTELFKEVKNAESIGVEADNIRLNLEKVMNRKNKVVESLKKGLEFNLKQKKVEIVMKEAFVVAENTIKAGDETYTCNKIVVATGSVPKKLKDYDFDNEFILNSDDLFNLKKIPEKVVIVGGGVEGIEWARIFNAMGTEVSVIEAMPKLLSIADEEVSKRVERIFKQEKIKMYLATTVDKIENKKIILSDGEILEPDFVLVAIGRKANRPEVKGKVTYLGDAYGSLMLANFAIYQARALVSGIHFDNVFVPSVVYGSPEIAWIGANEQDLPPNSYEKIVLPLSAIGKPYCDNAVDGFVKVLAYEGNIIGAHIISKEASALIHQFAIAMQNDITTEQLKKVCFAHPTYSEAVYESILEL